MQHRTSRRFLEEQYRLTEAGSVAHGYARHGFHRRRYESVLELMARHGVGSPGAADGTAPVLDLGCAVGIFSGLFQRRFGGRVIGLDIAWNAVSQAGRWLPEGRFVQGALPELPFRDEGFAGVIALEVLGYLDRDGVDQALAEVARLLRPGGWLCLVDQSGFKASAAVKLSVPWLQQRLRSHFTVVEVHYQHQQLHRLLTQRLLAAKSRIGYHRQILGDLDRTPSGRLGLAAPGLTRRRRLFALGLALPGVRGTLRLALGGLDFLERWVVHLLTLTWPAPWLDGLGRWFLPRWSRTEVQFFCRREEGSAGE
ncbi:MAG: class I SAM-dependent methyltransferase [Magnetococcales bacterium]|nr:class I SAM-dependent methyltransferase [Magnetococcales bacterium]MBF0156982.1 class I SAM-dependent methyltransferase [Magnetococcales bacterium]